MVELLNLISICLDISHQKPERGVEEVTAHRHHHIPPHQEEIKSRRKQSKHMQNPKKENIQSLRKENLTNKFVRTVLILHHLQILAQ